MAEDLHTSAIALMRLQFEAMTRSVWLLYAASAANFHEGAQRPQS